MDKFEHINELLSFYQQLLTERQQEILKYYYFEDMSISEISENLYISRAAVNDTLKKSEALLEEYESKLHLNENFKKRNEAYQQLKNLNNTQVNKILETLLKLED